MSALGTLGLPDISVAWPPGPTSPVPTSPPVPQSQFSTLPSDWPVSSADPPNSRMNVDLSDRYVPIGTPLSSDPGFFFRFLSLNVNGFDSHGTCQDVENLLRLCRKGNAHYVGFCETNVDFTTNSVRHEVSTAAKNSEPAMRCALLSSDIKTGSRYKPGGIATFARDKGSHRCSKIFSDDSGMGRYTVGLIGGNGCESIAAFTVYQCCRGAKGPRSIFTQQKQILAQNGMKDVCPREKLWEDLGNEIKKFRAKGCKIVMMGDFNNSLYVSERDRFARFCTENDLIDPLENLIPDKKNAATHIMGSNRIDYILIQPDILPHVRGYGLTGINKPFISDHRAVFMDLDFRSLFGETMAPLRKGSRRMVTSKIDVRTTKFLELVGEALEKERIGQRCNEILHRAATIGPTGEVGKAFTLLDRDFRNILLRSEQKAGRRVDSPSWSTKLHLALAEGKFWRLYIRELRRGRQPGPTIQALAKTLRWSTIPAVTLEEAKKRLRDAQAKIKEFTANDAKSRMEHLQDCKETAEINGDKSLAKTIGRIIQAESTKSTYSKLRWATKPSKSPGLAAVQLKDSDGSLKTITDPREMTPLLVEAGTQHFAQAEGTPFTVGPLADIEYTACCIQAGNILKGCSSFETDPDLSPEIQKWIGHAVHF